MRKFNRGFTLIETLIVILIIGILSGILLLTMENATSKAKAMRIIADLANLKAAVVLYYADDPQSFSAGSGGWSVISINALAGYTDRKLSEPYTVRSLTDWSNASKNPYFIYVSGPGSSTTYSTSDIHIYVAANVTNTYVDYAVRKQLEKLSPSEGIYDGSLSENLDDPSKSIFKAAKNPTNVGSNGAVVMRVR